MAKRLGVIQSSYIPWKGYFDFIDSVDEFVLLDDVQYSKGDWRNRNLIRTKDGLKWLTIPVDLTAKHFPNVNEVGIANRQWSSKHAQTLRHAYGRAPYFEDEWRRLADVYERAGAERLLSIVNRLLIEAVCRRLEISTPIRSSSDFELAEGKNERLISLCKQTGATEYLSGPAARSYIDESLFAQDGINVSYKTYEGYPEYRQLHDGFEHGVTILDVLFNTGPDARRFIKQAPSLR